MKSWCCLFAITIALLFGSACKQSLAPSSSSIDSPEKSAATCDKTTGTDPYPDSTINLSTYTASTPEAAASIKSLIGGQAVKSKTRVFGGVTDGMFRAYREQRLASNTGARGARPDKPSSASMRPKIHWLAKIGGPGETYLVNYEYYVNDNALYDIAGYKTMAYGEKIWSNFDNNPYNDYGYETALFQAVDSTERWYRHGAAQAYTGEEPFNTHSLRVSEWDDASSPYVYWLVKNLDNGTPEYNYYHVPASVFEDSNAYPIQETWYWNPPYHFNTIAMFVKTDGQLIYAATTKEGYENQTIIFRWSLADFKAAYSGAGGWHSQGWYIKDFDVEEGCITALLYVPTNAYTEKLLLNYTDESFNRVLGVYWNAGYRGIKIDSSW